MQVVHEEGSEPLSTWQINNFVKSEFARLRCDLEVPAEDGSTLTWTVTSLDKLLGHYVSESDVFRDVLREAVGKSGLEPLSGTLYLDEVVPGNLLRPDNKRKVWAIYLGLGEMGQSRLAREEFWLPWAVLRTRLAHDALGGVSGCIRALLRDMLLPPKAMSTVGVSLPLPAPTLVRIRISKILADEAAIKALWSIKGASGIRLCMFCANVVAKGSHLESDVDRLVTHTCSDPSVFQLVADSDMWQAFDRLGRDKPHLGKGKFEVLQRAAGQRAPPSKLEIPNKPSMGWCAFSENLKSWPLRRQVPRSVVLRRPLLRRSYGLRRPHGQRLLSLMRIMTIGTPTHVCVMGARPNLRRALVAR